MQKMSSKLHMLVLFEANWKPYKMKGAVDSKTLPSMKNILNTEP